MTYRTAYFCVECKQEVESGIRSYNRGTCPHCGHNNPSTIVDTISVSYRWSKRKRTISFLKIFSITMSVPVRQFKQKDVDQHQLCLPDDAEIV